MQAEPQGRKASPNEWGDVKGSARVSVGSGGGGVPVGASGQGGEGSGGGPHRAVGKQGDICRG